MGAEDKKGPRRSGPTGETSRLGSGPKWTFSVDTTEVPYVAYVDCDLANDRVPRVF